MRYLVVIALFLCFLSAAKAERDSLRVAFYNCENYFDSFRDSSINDADYTPASLRRWSYPRFISKRNNIYRVIAAMSDPIPPEIIGVCEVENRFVLNQLAYNTPLSKYSYAVIHQDSDDRRGIDVGLLYQPERLRLIGYRYFNPRRVDSLLKTRSILYAAFRWGEFDTLHLFVNHFPSKLGGTVSDKNRVLVAGFLKEKVDSVLRASPKANVIITGDFNDSPVGDALKLLSDQSVVNLAKPLYESGRGTIRYMGEWELIDQFLVSRSLFYAETPVGLSGGMEIFTAPFLLEKDDEWGGIKPLRTFNGYRYQNGYSDHLPVFIKLIREL